MKKEFISGVIVGIIATLVGLWLYNSIAKINWSSISSLSINTPTTIPNQPSIKLVPIALITSPPQEGWATTTIKIAFENIGNKMGSETISFQNATVETIEGFSYPVVAQINTWYTYDVESIQSPILPPQFRAAGTVNQGLGGIYVYTYQLQFRVAATSHPTKILIPDYGQIDLTQPVQELRYPTQNNDTATNNLPYTKEFAGKATVTITGFSQEYMYRSGVGGGKHILASYTFENLDPGFEQGVSLNFAIMGNDGLIIPATSFWSDCDPVLMGGPGQKVESRVCFMLYGLMEKYEISNPSAEDYFLIVWGDDFYAVIDTGY